MTDFDPNWPHGHMTRDGRRAEVLPRRLNHPEYPVLAIVTDASGVEVPGKFTAAGKWMTGVSDDDDLLNAPAPKRAWEGWAVMYRDGNVWLHPVAPVQIPCSLIAPVRIEFPEG